MITLKLSDDRTEIDLDRLAGAFGVGRGALREQLRLGTVTYWFELGGSDYDRPRTVFHSADSGIRLTLDHLGDVLTRTDRAARDARPAAPTHVDEDEDGERPGIGRDAAAQARLDALLDAALQDTFPASDPIAISFEAPKRPARAFGETP